MFTATLKKYVPPPLPVFPATLHCLPLSRPKYFHEGDTHHEVGIADVVLDEAAADDDHARVRRFHRHRVQTTKVWN